MRNIICGGKKQHISEQNSREENYEVSSCADNLYRGLKHMRAQRKTRTAALGYHFNIPTGLGFDPNFTTTTRYCLYFCKYCD